MNVNCHTCGEPITDLNDVFAVNGLLFHKHICWEPAEDWCDACGGGPCAHE